MNLYEATRQDLIRKAQNETPARYARRMNYVSTIKPMAVAKDLFIKTGTLTVPISVGDYIVTIHISGIMKLIRAELDSSNQPLPNRPLVYRALRRAVDESNVYVDCTCPDWRYRFKYWASVKDYNYGNPETRPSDITNPDNQGAVCKHITAALVRPSQWLKYVSGWISTVVRAYLENRLEMDVEDIKDLLTTEEIQDEVEDITDVDSSIIPEEESEESEEQETEKPNIDIRNEEVEELEDNGQSV